MISFENVTIKAGEFALCDASFRVEPGQYAVLMGATGCGKTSVLEAICGLRRVAAGTIRLGNVDVTDMKPALRGIGYVPQDGALFTHMTVANHLAFALRIRRASRTTIDQRVTALAKLLGIAHLLKRKPPGLSGGERQRVALGRALSSYPRVLLLDEPLSALDESTRSVMTALLKTVQQNERVTALHVTHSSEEALRLADCILRIDSGRVHPTDREELRAKIEHHAAASIVAPAGKTPGQFDMADCSNSESSRGA